MLGLEFSRFQMLRFLRVTHLAIIDSVELEFDAGLNVLSGETGAGKSILVGAVGLLLGGRASGDLVRTGEAAASVEAIFERGGAEVVVRREITAQGRSRAFINGELATAGALKELATDVVELHGQHEHQTLLDPATHLRVLDQFGRLESLVDPVRAEYEKLSATQDALLRLRSGVADREARLDLLTFQLNELDRANLRVREERLQPRRVEDEQIRGEASASVRAGSRAPAPVEKRPGDAAAAEEPEEDEELAAMRQVLANAERVERLCEESYASLYESDGAILAGLGHVWRRVTDLAALDARFQPYVDARDGIKSQLEDLALFLRRYADGIEASPERLQQIEDRLALLERLKRKYGPSLADVVARREALRAEWNELRKGDDRIAQLERDYAAAVARYLEAAAALSEARRTAAKRFSRELEGLLGDLAMDRTRFEVRFEPAHTGGRDATWTAEGVDVAQFVVSPNPGEELRPLARIVSGGELSRIMLAIKTLTFGARVDSGGRRASADEPGGPGESPVSVPPARRSAAGGTAAARNAPGAPGLIFDEIDAGIGGRVADVVGRELHALGSVFQVLCITHLPQIAAYADTHFQIDKRVENNRTVTTVRRLSSEGRVDELARMLGGAVISEGLRASAREMLAERRRFRLDGGEAKGEGKEKGESERAGAQRRKWRGSTS